MAMDRKEVKLLIYKGFSIAKILTLSIHTAGVTSSKLVLPTKFKK
ncbi:MAG: hypothetical protein RI918_1481 [Pseudomonadota bacterium]